METFVCPHCGSVIPADSRSCPECGSDRETGWSEEYHADWAPQQEEPEDPPRRRAVRKLVRYSGAVVAVLLIAGLLSLEWPPYGLYLGCVLMAASIIAFIVFRDRPLSKRNREKRLEEELLGLCGQDRTLVNRLVLFEGNLRPGSPRAVLLRNAIHRILRDRSR